MGFIKFIRVKSGNLKKLLHLRKAVIKVRKVKKSSYESYESYKKLRIGDFSIECAVVQQPHKQTRQTKHI